MQSVIKTFAVMCLVAPMVALTGCAATGYGGGGDTALMGDLLTERAVHRTLYGQTELSDDAIVVSCIDGVVTLTGIVDNDVDRALAARLAQGVDGVSSVTNNLTVRS